MSVPLWSPPPERIAASSFTKYLQHLRASRGVDLAGYNAAWQWSTTEIEQFWESLLEFFHVDATPHARVLENRSMPGARWFEGARLNYAQQALRHEGGDTPAILYQSELHPLRSMSWNELRAQVASVAAHLREMGVQPGDRVCAYLPNSPHAVVALLATASIGAVWSSCAPEFGVEGVVERFRQLEPKVLFAVDGYSYAGRRIDRMAALASLRAQLPMLQHTVLVPCLDEHAEMSGTLRWNELLARDVALHFEPVPFEHPLWVLFSSGTTGAPKGIVHGHGGIVLEHMKSIVLQNDMRAGDRFFWFTTTGWMMWNLLLGGLLAGCTVVLYDGSPTHPDHSVLWRLAQDARVTRFGASAAYFSACMNAGITPRTQVDLSALRAVGSTGSPLTADAFDWIYRSVKPDVWLASSSGGTDVASAFLCGCPGKPVYAGELQGAALGARVQAFDASGRAVIDEVGELVITAPMPSMPLSLWNDADGSRYRDSYFDVYPGIWRHGDWVCFNERGGAVIYGRSDSTLNRYGVRIGTAEIYTAVESVPGVKDSLVVGIEQPDGGYWMPLFIVLEDGVVLDDSLRTKIRDRIRTAASPRHVPDDIIAIDEVPRTLNGKKVEVPVKRLLLGDAVCDVVNPASLANPSALDVFVSLALNGLGSYRG